jgi:hypothetical protein
LINNRRLQLVPSLEEVEPEVLFCGHCGETPPTSLAAQSRVCSLCGLGVVISTGQTLAPRPGSAFVIVDGALSLCALSARAEKLLGVDEPEAVHRHVGEFLEPADAEAARGDELVRAIIAAAGGVEGPRNVVVRPTGEFGVRFTASIGRCGPPAGALLVISDGVV